MPHRLCWSLALACLAALPGSPSARGQGIGGAARTIDARSVAEIKGFPDWVTSVAFSPDGALLAAGSYEVVRLWDVAARQPAGELRMRSGFARSVAFSPDGKTLAAGGYQTVVLWDVATRERVGELKGHRGYVSGVPFSPDGARLATASEDLTARIWDVARRREVRRLDGHVYPVLGVAFSPDGTLLATAAGDETRLTRPGEVKTWSAETGELLHTFPSHERAATGVAFSPDGSLLVSTSLDEKVNVYDPASGQARGFFGGHSRPTNSVAFAAGGRVVVSGSGGRFQGKNEVLFWTPDEGETLGTIDHHEGKVTAVAVSPDGVHVAAASFDKTVSVWDVTAILQKAGTDESQRHGGAPEKLVSDAPLAAAAAAPGLRAGAFAADITPTEFPVSSNGGMTDRQTTYAHDPLHARCLVLDDGTTPLVIVVCDSCMVPRDLMDAIKRVAAGQTGIPVENMLIAATHTHSAVTLTGVFQSDPEPAYREFFVRRVAEGIVQAHRQLEPARVGWAVGRDGSQVFNRRWFTQTGVANADPFGRTSDVVRMNPGYNRDVIDRPAGPVDPEVCLLSVQSQGGRPIALLANYSLHYVGGVPGDALSADYFGEFARRIEERIGATGLDPPFVGIMSNGTSGNINNVNYAGTPPGRRESFEQIRTVAASVADAAFRAYRTIEHAGDATLAAAQSEIELGVRLPSGEDVSAARRLLDEAGPGPYRDRRHIYARETLLLRHYPPRVKVILQALRIGGLGIVSSPCETFVETGLAIKEHSPLKPTFCIELANGYNGYLPTPEHHEWGGYETWRARSSYLEPGAEPEIRRTLLRLLGDVAR